jgi:hypothetical protein
MESYQGNCGGFLTNSLASVVVSAVVTAISYLLLSFVIADGNSVELLCFAIFFFMWNIYPIVVSSNVASSILEISEFNEDRDDKIEVPHPKKNFIFILSIAGFFTGGLTTLVALYMGSGSFNVQLADNVSKKLTTSH